MTYSIMLTSNLLVCQSQHVLQTTLTRFIMFFSEYAETWARIGPKLFVISQIKRLSPSLEVRFEI